MSEGGAVRGEGRVEGDDVRRERLIRLRRGRRVVDLADHPQVRVLL